jgi:hypothetical protein
MEFFVITAALHSLLRHRRKCICPLFLLLRAEKQPTGTNVRFAKVQAELKKFSLMNKYGFNYNDQE